MDGTFKKMENSYFHFKSTTLDMLISIYSVQQQTFPFMNHPVSNSVWNLIINVTQQDALKMQECMIKLVIPTALTKKGSYLYLKYVIVSQSNDNCLQS